MLKIQNILLYCIYTPILQVNNVTRRVRYAKTLSWRGVSEMSGDVRDHCVSPTISTASCRSCPGLFNCSNVANVESGLNVRRGNTWKYCRIIEYNIKTVDNWPYFSTTTCWGYIYIYLYMYISTTCPCFRVEALSSWWNKQGWFRLIIQYGFLAFVPRLPRCHHFSWKKCGGKP